MLFLKPACADFKHANCLLKEVLAENYSNKGFSVKKLTVLQETLYALNLQAQKRTVPCDIRKPMVFS